MPSGAGLNRGGVVGGVTLLTVPTTATPLTPTGAISPAYGTIGVNDSGGMMFYCAGFTKWTFQLIGPGVNSAGVSVAIYGTLDPAGLNYIYANGAHSGVSMDLCAQTVVPYTSWQLVPAPSEQGGTGTVANPMVTGGSTMLVSGTGWYAVRAVCTALSSPSGPVTVLASAVP
jgi:hypothetical protein